MTSTSNRPGNRTAAANVWLQLDGYAAGPGGEQSDPAGRAVARWLDVVEKIVFYRTCGRPAGATHLSPPTGGGVADGRQVVVKNSASSAVSA